MLIPPHRCLRALNHTVLARRLRKVISAFVLAACVISLALLLHDRYPLGLSGPVAAEVVGGATYEVQPQQRRVNTAMDANSRKYKTLGQYLARRYMISAEVATDIVARAHAVGMEMNLDPLVILAVISIESRFNPIAESANGAKGLMQIIPHLHRDKLRAAGADKAVFEPSANISIGARILQEYLHRTRDLGEALQMYVGQADNNDMGYAAKVLAERDRLSAVLRQYGKQLTSL